MSVWFSQPHTLLQRVKACTTEEDQEKLMEITSQHSLNAFLLPIKTVGVQVSYMISLTGIWLSAACFYKVWIWNYFGELNVTYSKFRKVKLLYRWLWSEWTYKNWTLRHRFYSFSILFCFTYSQSKTFREPFTSQFADQRSGLIYLYT